MLAKAFVIFASLALASAAPKRKVCPPKHTSSTAPTSSAPSSTAPAASGPTLPVNGGARELAAPPPGAKITHVALGLGYQNYTCDGPGATAKANGALAHLFDMVPLYPGQAGSPLDMNGWLSLTTTVAWTIPVPLNTVPGTDGRQPNSEPGASPTDPFKAPSPLDLSAIGLGAPLAYKGRHYFDFSGVPVFELEGGDIFRGAKNDSISAPANASKGEDDSAAVAWLLLTSVDGSKNVDYVYRVVTVGGSAHTCVNAGADSSIYTALYYFVKK